MEAAYKPVVNGDLDTQNFEKFDEVSITKEICHLSHLVNISDSFSYDENHRNHQLKKY